MNARKPLCILLTCLFISANALTPETALGLTVKEEEEMASEFLKVVRKHFDLINDPLIQGYVEKIGRRILETVEPQPFSFHFYVIREDVYNAFAGPAGHIFINSGLFEAMETENELAGILAHEISHAVCRHISERIARATKINLATLAGVAAGILLGVGGAGEAANAVTMGSMAAGQSMALAYSREDEMQADQIGMRYLTDAGYDGQGLLVMLKKIRNKQWFGTKEIPTYLRTHPATEERIAYIDGWLADRGAEVPDAPPAPSNAFIRAHTRLVVLYGDEQAMLKKFKERLDAAPDDPEANYAYGLILARVGNRDEAIKRLKKALEKKAFDPYILVDLGRIYFIEGRYAEALKTLEGAMSIGPNDPLGLFYLGRTRLETGHFAEAAEAFETLLKERPDYSEAFYFLGEAYGKQRIPEQAHYYLGLHYQMKGELKNAVFHLKKAARHENDPDKQEKIREILKRLKKEGEG